MNCLKKVIQLKKKIPIRYIQLNNKANFSKNLSFFLITVISKNVWTYFMMTWKRSRKCWKTLQSKIEILNYIQLCSDCSDSSFNDYLVSLFVLWITNNYQRGVKIVRLSHKIEIEQLNSSKLLWWFFWLN
jgi:hypothetical protein